VGFARRKASAAGWALCPPVISADGLNNEFERPHVVHLAGLYYLFWSTQRHVFEPAGARGPTGLYGMVSSQLLEGWKPLNGTGLAFANPERAPAQSNSWFVLPDLTVASFIDNWGGGSPRRFGGTFAPFVRLGLQGSTHRARTRVTSQRLIAGVELGGTKSIAVLARGRELLERAQCPTTTPEATLDFIHAHLQAWIQRIDRRARHRIFDRFASMRVPPTTEPCSRPRSRLTGAKVGERLTSGLRCPRGSTPTDAAALAEWKWGLPRSRVVCSLTIGTGLGGGILIEGRPLHGALHPEFGHLRCAECRVTRFRVSVRSMAIASKPLSRPGIDRAVGVLRRDVREDPRWASAAHDFPLSHWP
jgi:hypothetical protein